MIDSAALDTLFHHARTHSAWTPQPVTDEDLQRVFDVMRWAPTSMNLQPARFVFLRTPEAKARIKPMLAPGNVDKTMAAPVVVIVAHDTDFHTHAPRLFPPAPGARAGFEGEEKRVARETFALRNGSLQGAYFIVAARACGLDCGPMSGFDNARVDAEFFPEGRVRSNFLINLGHGDPARVHPRLPRFAFDEVCQLL